MVECTRVPATYVCKCFRLEFAIFACYAQSIRCGSYICNHPSASAAWTPFRYSHVEILWLIHAQSSRYLPVRSRGSAALRRGSSSLVRFCEPVHAHRTVPRAFSGLLGICRPTRASSAPVGDSWDKKDLPGDLPGRPPADSMRHISRICISSLPRPFSRICLRVSQSASSSCSSSNSDIWPP